MAATLPISGSGLVGHWGRPHRQGRRSLPVMAGLLALATAGGLVLPTLTRPATSVASHAPSVPAGAAGGRAGAGAQAAIGAHVAAGSSAPRHQAAARAGGTAGADSTGARMLPGGLVTAVQGALGGDGLRQSLHADGGLHVAEAASPTTSWSITPTSLGRVGGSNRSLTAGTPTTAGGKTTYPMGPLSTWYRSSVAGVEQGFTVPRRPAGNGVDAAIMLTSGGSLTPVVTGSTTLTLENAEGAHVLTYGDLVVTDATGRHLPAHLAAAGHGVTITFDDQGAAYPVTVDPLVQQAVLTPTGTTKYFGSSVALTGNGTTALVGDTTQSAAFVFTLSGTTWTQRAKLTSAGVVAHDQFGEVVSISPDGTTALISATHANGTVNTQGTVYVFTGSGASWSQQAKLVASDPTLNSYFGMATALSANGSTALITSPFHSAGSVIDRGAAYIFTRSGNTWTQRKEFTPSDGPQFDQFGTACALSADGTVALVAAPGHSPGYVYVFTGSGSSWTQQTELQAQGVTTSQFGHSVALSGDGKTAVVGAPDTKVGTNTYEGAAFVFTSTSGTWSQRTELTISDGKSGSYWGWSASLSSDGSAALLGDPESSPGGAYLFTRATGSWTQDGANLIPASGSGGFGESVALSAHGTIALVAAPYGAAGITGKVFVFAQGTPPAFTADTPPAAAPPAQPYSYTFTASGTPAPTYSVGSGSLPPGLTLDPTTGVLSGTPTKPGAYTFTVVASNGVTPDAVTGTLTLTVAGATLYAAPTAQGSGSCLDAADACTLVTALSEATPGATILLTQAGTATASSTWYDGGFTASVPDTTATLPVTIEPMTGLSSAPVLDGGGTMAVLDVENGTALSLAGVTVQHGFSTTVAGGLDNNDGGTVTVTDGTFADNQGGDGGAIDNGDGSAAGSGTGTLRVVDATFTANTASGDGGAIDNGEYLGTGTLTVSGSAFTGNQANDGGAIDNGDEGTGTLTVATSTFTGTPGTPTALVDGGAIDNGDNAGTGTLTVTDSTFVADQATFGNGGAIDNGDYTGTGTLTVSASTFSGNQAVNGGGIANGADTGTGTLTVTADTFSGNAATGPAGGATVDNGPTSTVSVAADMIAGSCHSTGEWVDWGYNVGSDAPCLNGAGTDRLDPDLATALGTLADNGGPTETVLPLAGNPGIGNIPVTTTVDGGTVALCPATDQRGTPSATGATCDAGSVQVPGIPATQVAITTPARSGPAGPTASLGPITVVLEDAAGHRVNAPAGGTTLDLSSTSANGVFATTATGSTVTSVTVAATAATASFYYGDTTAGRPTVTASASGLAATQSETIAAGPLAQLGVSAPDTATAGTSFPFTVTAEDQFGNTVTTFDGTVSFTSSDTALGVTLPGPGALANGVGTFPAILATPGPQTLTATDRATATVSGTATVTVHPGAVASLAFTTTPSTFTAGGSTAVSVTAYDQDGNVTTNSGDQVTLTATTGTFSGLGPVTLTSGTASFTVSTATTGRYTLTAHDGAIASPASHAFTVHPGAVASLAFTTTPSTFTAGGSTTATVAAYDSHGNVATTSTDSVTLTASTGSFTGLGPVALTDGTASFTLSTTTAGAYTVTAHDGPVASPASSGFTVAPGPVATLAFTTQPAGFVAGGSTTATVTAFDSHGNVATTSTDQVTLTASSVSLEGLGPVALTQGVASFTLSTTITGSYTVTAHDGAITSPASNGMTVAPGPVASLSFASQPAAFVAGDSTTAVVTAEDQYGNVATDSTDEVTLTATAGSFGGLGPVALTDGRASFTVSTTTTGTYTLTAHDGSVASPASHDFMVTPGPVASLAFTTTPAGFVAGGSTATAVTAYDQYGNVATTSADQVSLTPSTGTFTGLGPVTLASGMASFTVSTDTAGAYTLTAHDASISSPASSSFTVSAGPVTSLAFTTTPSGFVAGGSTATAVTAYDQYGNVADDSTDQVVLTPDTGSFTGLGPVALTGGTAAFTVAGTTAGSYTLTATDGPVSSPASAGFTVAPGSASSFTVTAPATAAAGVPFDVTVTAQDAFGNTATGYAGTVGFTSSDAGATLPDSYSFGEPDAGTHTFDGVVLGTVGTQTITTADTTDATLTGTSQPITVSDVPGAPQNPAATAAGALPANSAVATWTAPATDGGSPVTGYTLVADDLTSGQSAAPVTEPTGTTSGTLSNLVAGDLYQVTITATNARGTGPVATTNQVVPVAAAVPTSQTASGTSTSVNGTATASVGTAGQIGSVSATAKGRGTITVSTYPTNPLPDVNVGGTFFDVSVASGSHFTQLTFTLCGVPATSPVEWWNASATPPGYQAASDQTAPSGPNDCVTITVANSTSPSLSQLIGTVFVVLAPATQGYTEVAGDGGVFAFGTAQFYGSMGGKPLNAPIVGIARTPTHKGYWEVASDGGVFAFGSAQFSGSMGGQALDQPIVGIAATPDGQGYWEVASDGGIFAFGTAQFSGSMGGQHLARPVVGIQATPDGQGYWEVAADGGIFAFGDATFTGSMGGQHLARPVVGIQATPDGQGYWEVAADGGIFAFGDAKFEGSMAGQPLSGPVVGVAAG